METVSDGRLIHLDVQALAHEMSGAMERHSISLARKSVVDEMSSQTHPMAFMMSVTSSRRNG
jgi:hypothetical protein